jgi:threonine/homoserine/homoserine lactone efflux protein
MADHAFVLPALAMGLGLGVFVAAQVGPIWLLCARSSLRYGARSGLAIGAGAALVDFFYAVLGVLGAAQLVRITPVRLGLGLAGAAFLCWLGARTAWQATRIRAGAEADGEVLAPRAAFRTSVIATASNPITIASWAAIFSAASVGHVADTTAGAAVLLLGIGLGSFAWFAVLSTVTGRLIRRRVSARALRIADVLSGSGIAAFGLLLGWRTARSAQ